MMVNKIDRPNTTPTVRGICRCLPFSFRSSDLSVASLLFMKGVLCYKEKIEPLDRVMTDSKRDHRSA